MKHICAACREGNCDYCSNYFGEDNMDVCFCSDCEEDVYAKLDEDRPTYLYGVGTDYETDEWN